MNSSRIQFVNSSRTVPESRCSRVGDGEDGEGNELEFSSSSRSVQFFERGRGVQVQFEFAFVSQIRAQLKEQMRKAWMAKYDGKGAREGGVRVQFQFISKSKDFLLAGGGEVRVRFGFQFIPISFGVNVSAGARSVLRKSMTRWLFWGRGSAGAWSVLQRPANSVCNRRPSRCFTGAWQR